MILTQVDWRQLKVGDLYIHYNGYELDPGPHYVTVTTIWYPAGDDYAFIYTNDDKAYYVSDERTNLTVNNTFYNYIEGHHIRPTNLGNAGFPCIEAEQESPMANSDDESVNAEDIYENPE